MFLAIVAFIGTDALKVQIEEVGRFSKKEDAQSAVEDFIENVLEIERPGYTHLAEKIMEI